jgi:hypothetical protein
MHWYFFFALAILLLWLTATAADRPALFVILCATAASWLIVDLVTVRFTGAWKLVVPGFVETATILALLRWARSRSGWQQVGCVSVAWLAHVLCFYDLQFGANLVYDRYETILALVAAAQVALFYDTYTHHLRRLGRWWDSLGANRGGAVSHAGASAVVLHRPGGTGLPPAAP